MKTLWKAAVAVAALACSVWAIHRFAAVPQQCNAAISELTSRTNAAAGIASDYDRLRRVRRNLEELQPLRRACPTQVRVPFLIGANFELSGQPAEALRHYRDALTVDRRPEIYVAIALVQLQLGDVDGAIDNYVIAARFDKYIVGEIASPEVQRRVRERLPARGRVEPRRPGLESRPS
jgi:tetratricopeptide (TPR) repeat protein